MPGCDRGVGVAKYRTPALMFNNALKMLDMHRADCHEVEDLSPGVTADQVEAQHPGEDQQGAL